MGRLLFWPCLLLALLAAPAGAATTIYVVDLEKALTRSQTAQAGQNHLKEARKALEKGFEDLRALYDGQPEETRQRILSEGATALTNQLNIEQQAINSVITEIMLREIRLWRQANNADIVMARQNVLDAADTVDITDAIIQAMDKNKPKFADLPVVSISPPAQPQTAQPAPQPPAPQKRKKGRE